MGNDPSPTGSHPVLGSLVLYLVLVVPVVVGIAVSPAPNWLAPAVGVALTVYFCVLARRHIFNQGKPRG